MDCNYINITGVVNKVYTVVTTPNDIKISKFVISHESKQIEYGVEKTVKIRLFCLFVGFIIDSSWLNKQIELIGFIDIKADKSFVLHVKQIKSL